MEIQRIQIAPPDVLQHEQIQTSEEIDMNIPSLRQFSASLLAIAAIGLFTAGPQANADSSMRASATAQTPPGMNEFGGPMYTGQPALPVTVAFVMAGGGPGNFSLVTALNSMLGQQTVNAEVKKLTRQYGKRRVHDWVTGIDFAVNDTLKIAQSRGIKLPQPANLSGKQLAVALVKAGTDGQGTFWAGYLFDHALSHPIHMQVMADTDAKYGHAYDGNYHAVTNQAFYDVAHALGYNGVKLASYH